MNPFWWVIIGLAVFAVWGIASTSKEATELAGVGPYVGILFGAVLVPALYFSINIIGKVWYQQLVFWLAFTVLLRLVDQWEERRTKSNDFKPGS